MFWILSPWLIPTSFLSLLLPWLGGRLAVLSPLFFVSALQDMFLMAAMGPPGGGRTVISPRLQSRFNIINMTFPTVRPWGLGEGLYRAYHGGLVEPGD